MAKFFKINIKTIFSKAGTAKAIAGLKSVKNAAKSAGQWLNRMGSRAVIGGIALVTVGIWKLVGALRAFATQELSEVNLVAALKQVGSYTDEYYEKLKRLASEFQETTKVGDELWLQQFAQLTRFGMNAGNVDKVSNALKNLAGLMDGNVQGAALALQRAIEGEFSMFSRYGIKLDLTGDKLKDLNNLFEILASKGGGAMEARAMTLQGAWDGMTNALGDFKEEVGRTFEKATGLRGIFGQIEEQLKRLQESAKSGSLKNIIEGGVEKAREFLTQIQGIVKYVESEGSKAIADIAGASKDVVIGLFEMAAEAALKLMMLAAPRIGDAIASQIKDLIVPDMDKVAFFERYNNATNIETKQPFTKEEIKDLWLKRKGEDGAAKVGNAGSDRFNNGLDQFKGMGVTGNARAAAQKEDRERRAAELAAQATRQRQAMEEARGLYARQRQQERVAKSGLAVAGMHGSGVAEAQATLEREQKETAEVASLIRAVQAGDNGLTGQMLSALQAVVANQSKQAAQIEQLGSQIKNGRS